MMSKLSRESRSSRSRLNRKAGGCEPPFRQQQRCRAVVLLGQRSGLQQPGRLSAAAVAAATGADAAHIPNINTWLLQRGSSISKRHMLLLLLLPGWWAPQASSSNSGNQRQIQRCVATLSAPWTQLLCQLYQPGCCS